MASLALVNVGSAPDDDTGDPLRTAFQSINASLTALNAELVSTTALAGANESAIAALGSVASLDEIALSDMADLAQDRIIGRATESTGAPEALTPGQVRSIINVEDGATADQSDAEIETAYNNQVDVVSQAEAEAGVATTPRRWTAERVAQAIAAQAGEGTDDQTAAEVAFTPAGDIEATDMQGAIEELDSEKSPTGHGHTLGDISDSGALAALDTVDTGQIDDEAVTLAKLAHIATARFLGRITGSTGDVEALTAAQMRTALNVEDGAAADQSAAEVTVAASPANYTPDNSSTEGHLAGIDDALATIPTGALADLDLVGTAQIDAEAVTGVELADDAVDTNHLAAGAVDRPALATRSRNAQTGTSYTLALTDENGIVSMNNAGANTLTIPANASVAFPVNAQVDVFQLGAGATTVEGASGVTVNGVSTGSTDISNRYAGVTLLKVATNEWVMMGSHGTVS